MKYLMLALFAGFSLSAAARAATLSCTTFAAPLARFELREVSPNSGRFLLSGKWHRVPGCVEGLNSKVAYEEMVDWECARENDEWSLDAQAAVAELNAESARSHGSALDVNGFPARISTRSLEITLAPAATNSEYEGRFWLTAYDAGSEFRCTLNRSN